MKNQPSSIVCINLIENQLQYLKIGYSSDDRSNYNLVLFPKICFQNPSILFYTLIYPFYSFASSQVLLQFFETLQGVSDFKLRSNVFFFCVIKNLLRVYYD